MEATADLSTILENQTFGLEAYDSIKELAFSSSASTDRFKALLSDLEAKAAGGQGDAAAISLKLGMCYLLVGNTGEAMRRLKEAGSDVQARYFLGRTYLDRRQYEDAIAEFEAARQQGWDRLECDCRCAEARLLLGQHDEAERLLDAHAAAHASSARWQYSRGRLAEVLGDLGEAVAHYERAIKLEDGHVEAMFRLAYLLDLHGDDAGAFELYSACAERPAVHANVLINLAIIHEDRGEYEKAAHYLRRVLATNPNHRRAGLFLKDVRAASTMYIDEQMAIDQEKQNAVLDIPISDFELSVRSRNCLKKMNINSLGDLLKISEVELLAYKNFGETSLKEIQAMLSQKGLTLGQYAQNNTGEAAAATVAETVPDGAPEVLSKPVSALEFSVRARKCLQRLGITTVGELASKTEPELLGSKNFGSTSLTEIKERLAELGVSLRPIG